MKAERARASLSVRVHNDTLCPTMPAKAGKLLSIEDRLALQAEVLHHRFALGQTQDYIAGRIRKSQSAIVKAEKGDIGPEMRDALLLDWGVTMDDLRRKHGPMIRRIRVHENPERALKAALGPAGKASGGAHDPLEAIHLVSEAADALTEDDGVQIHIARSVALAVLQEPGQARTALAVYRTARRRLNLVSASSSKPTS